MSKARARERKKAAMAKRLAAAASPQELHETGADPVPDQIRAEKNHAGKFDPTANKSGGKNSGGKNIPNLAASSRGAARSG
jgi:hypothetical protein